MPRALVITRTTVPAAARESYRAALPRRRDAFAAARVNFWVFEDPATPGAYVEFTEARDEATLSAACRAVDGLPPAPPILREVE